MKKMRIMQKILSLALMLVLVMGTATVFADVPEGYAETVDRSNSTIADSSKVKYNPGELKQLQEAVQLKNLGLMAGVSPISYAIEKVPTRAESIVMLVRLMGKESEALAKSRKTPFTDVPNWAAPYVGYAYEAGYSKGISSTLFGSNNPAKPEDYLTLMLRALGYSDAKGDFDYLSSFNLANKVGILAFNPENAKFTRGDLISISYASLSAKIKGTDKSLLGRLYDMKAVSTASVIGGNHEAKLKGTVVTGLKTVIVSTVPEFLDAINSDTRIILNPGVYNLTNIGSLKKQRFQVIVGEGFDGSELIINKVNNCHIVASDAGKVEIVTEPRYATVLTFSNCENCSISNITLGHTKDKGYCTGGVVKFENSLKCSISNCVLYGCGTYGVELQNTENIFVRDSEMKECTYGGASLSGATNTIFLNCYIHDCQCYGPVISTYATQNLELVNCIFKNNKAL